MIHNLYSSSVKANYKRKFEFYQENISIQDWLSSRKLASAETKQIELKIDFL